MLGLRASLHAAAKEAAPVFGGADVILLGQASRPVILTRRRHDW